MNKIGLHIIGGTTLDLGRPAVVKLVDPSPEYVREVRARVGPACLIIVRWQDGHELENTAQTWINRHYPQMRQMRGYGSEEDSNLAFEGPNETGDGSAPRYAGWEIQRLGLMHAMSLRSVIGNWSVGTPDLPTWDYYKPVIDAMYPGDLVGLHEYWIDGDDIANRWHCGRWTLVKELKDRPLVITECGRDVVERRGQPGWQRSCSAEEFIEDLESYNLLLSGFPNVVGATVFQAGSLDRHWQTYNVTGIWPRVVAQYRNGGTPMPEPKTKTTLVEPVAGHWPMSQGWMGHAVDYSPYPGHEGMDFACPEGTVVRAMHAGECYIGNPSGEYRAYGTHLWIKGTDEQGRAYWSILAHLSRILVDNREMVQPGNIVALSGTTGRSTGPHVHAGLETQDIKSGFQDPHDPAYYWQPIEDHLP